MKLYELLRFIDSDNTELMIDHWDTLDEPFYGSLKSLKTLTYDELKGLNFINGRIRFIQPYIDTFKCDFGVTSVVKLMIILEHDYD